MTSRTLTQETKDLIAAKARIEDPENWWDGSDETDDGDVGPCAMLALWDIGPAFNVKASQFLRKASSEMFGEDPIWVNDNLGHPAVMRMYDRAIELSMEG